MWKVIEKDGTKTIEIGSDGNPIWENSDKTTMSVDWDRAKTGMINLRAENKIRREKNEELEANLNVMKEDQERNKNKNNDKNTTDNDEINARIEQMKNQFATELANKDKMMDNLLIGNEFAGSVYIKENLTLPSDISKEYFGKNFVVKDGKVVGQLNGLDILSQKHPGELASFNESMEIIVNNYAGKASILKANRQSGGGSTGSKSNISTDTSNLYIGEMSMKNKIDFIKKNGQDEFQKLAEKGGRPSTK